MIPEEDVHPSLPKGEGRILGKVAPVEWRGNMRGRERDGLDESDSSSEGNSGRKAQTSHRLCPALPPKGDGGRAVGTSAPIATPASRRKKGALPSPFLSRGRTLHSLLLLELAELEGGGTPSVLAAGTRPGGPGRDPKMGGNIPEG
jgi:hypothetical protein